MDSDRPIIDKVAALNGRSAIVIVILIISLISGSVFLISEQTFLSVSDSLQAANLATNVLLTLALIIIYTNIAQSNRKQVSQYGDLVAAQERQSEIVEKQIEAEERHREINERQTEILHSQSEIMEKQAQISEHQATPVLAVEDYDIDEDSVSVWLTNYGESPAKDLYLEIEIRSDDDERDLEPIKIPLTRTESTGGDIVATGEEKVQFEAGGIGGRFEITGKREYVNFRGLMSSLGKEKAGRLGVELHVSYTGPLGSESQMSVFPRGQILLTPLPADSLPLSRCVEEGEFIPAGSYQYRS